MYHLCPFAKRLFAYCGAGIHIIKAMFQVSDPWIYKNNTFNIFQKKRLSSHNLFANVNIVDIVRLSAP